MAKAVLPNGHEIEFPDETPDHEIHAHVRSQMGLPPPEPPPPPPEPPGPSPDTQAALMAVQHIQGAVDMLAGVMQESNDRLLQAAVSLQQAAQALVVHAQANTETAAATHQHLAAVTDELRRPKKAVKAKDGSWSTEPVKGTV